MNTYLYIETKDGKVLKTTRDTTIKENEKFFKKHLKDDDNVIYVAIRYFDGWYTRTRKVLKDTRNKGGK